jgi:serine/threonine protein phosphatase 1
MPAIERRRFVIGDIHGCINTLKKMLEDTLHISKSDEVFLLGDYIDRGPDSKAVIDYIMLMQEMGYSLHCLMGNHEKLLIDALGSPFNENIWAYNGSYHTLQSFGISSAEELNPKYVNFFKTLHYYFELDDFVIVHAGLNFNIEDPLTDTNAMLWIRDESVDISKINNRRIVCGHTPIQLFQIRESLTSDKIMLDGGCVYEYKHNGLGKLVALELNSMELTAIECIDYL